MGARCVTATTMRRSGQCSGPQIWRALRAPAGRSTKPPNTERAADAEPARAIAERSAGEGSQPAARAHAPASAANPDEELASPAEVGNEFVLAARNRARDAEGMPQRVEEK